jgi:penicillin-binding protein 1C
LLERLITGFIAERRSSGVENATAILIDSRDQSVKALVGSADYLSTGIHGQVNGVLARRSPGSTLKPFLYGLALDQGVIHPMSILKDLPSNFGYFQPENFDGSFVGPLTARDALIRSRNIPAVWLASQVKSPSLYGLLQRAGIKGLRDESHYGLALALGGGEMTPEELARLYVMLAGDGHLRPLRYLQEQPQSIGPQLLTPKPRLCCATCCGATRVRMVYPHATGAPPGKPAPPGAFTTRGAPAWSAHTCWWCGWVTSTGARIRPSSAPRPPRRCSSASPTPCPGLAQRGDQSRQATRRAGAHRRLRRLGRTAQPLVPANPQDLVHPRRVPDSRVQPHRPVLIDTRTGKAACPPFDPQYTREEVFEFWPSDVQRLYRAAGLPRRTPPTVMKTASPTAPATRAKRRKSARR